MLLTRAKASTERAAKRALPATKSSASKSSSKRDGRATKRKQRTASTSQVEAFDQPEDECERTGKHPVHVISTATPPKSIKLWPEPGTKGTINFAQTVAYRRPHQLAVTSNDRRNQHRQQHSLHYKCYCEIERKVNTPPTG